MGTYSSPKDRTKTNPTHMVPARDYRHLTTFSTTRHPWVISQIENGTFGSESDAGLVQVAAGGMHTLILDENGTVWSCGVNDDSALGRTIEATDPEHSSNFHPVQTLLDENFRAVSISAGDSFGAALNQEGDLRLWGAFRDAQGNPLFSPGVDHQNLPVELKLPQKSGSITSIATGDNHLVALMSQGDIYTWGVGEVGQLGRRVVSRHQTGATIPEKVNLGTRTRKAVLIGAGQSTSFAVDDIGDVWAWGMNSMGHAGIGTVEDPYELFITLPTKVESLSTNGEHRVVQIEGGEHHTLFLTASGRVYACGRCDDGQLGQEVTQPCVPKPVEVHFPEEDTIVHVAAASRYNMAITEKGYMYSWGGGPQGELGLGLDVKVAYGPIMITKKDGSWAAKKVSCGGQHVVGLFQHRFE